VATTPQVPGEVETADSRSEVAGSTTAEARTSEPAPSPPTPHARSEEQPGRGGEFDTSVEEIRRLFGSNLAILPRLEDLIRRRLGLAPLSPGAAAYAGLTGIGIRLALALSATALVGQWTDIPWGRWAVILVFYGLFDGTQMRRTPPLDTEVSPWLRRWGERMTPLLPTIVREPDRQDLTAFIRRWERLPVVVLVGVAVAALMLGATWLYTPTGMSELPVGSIVLLALLLYDFGALMVFGSLFEWAFVARQARYDHRLFWLSPADSPEVRKAMQMWNVRALAGWITVYLVLTLVLVSWDSPVVVPLAVGFIVIGYLATMSAALGDRAGVRKIVERARDQQLETLQRRIDAFRSSYTQLTPLESEQLRGLVDLHSVIRNAPTASTTHPLLRAAAGLIVPTIVFVITVFGEVSAERILDDILP
jgi:hypothetical protein